MVLFPSRGFLALGDLNWSGFLCVRFVCFGTFSRYFCCCFFVFCGGEVRSLGEAGGLVPFRLLRTPHSSEALPRWGIRRYV